MEVVKSRQSEGWWKKKLAEVGRTHKNASSTCQQYMIWRYCNILGLGIFKNLCGFFKFFFLSQNCFNTSRPKNDNILRPKFETIIKSCENILIFHISFKVLIRAKPLRIMFDKAEGFIRDYDGTRYLVLLDSEKYDAIYSRIRYLEDQKIGITYLFSHNYAKIKIDSSVFIKD